MPEQATLLDAKNFLLVCRVLSMACHALPILLSRECFVSLVLRLPCLAQLFASELTVDPSGLARIRHVIMTFLVGFSLLGIDMNASSFTPS